MLMSLLLEEKKMVNKEEAIILKRKATIAVELSKKHHVKRVYVQSIDNYSAKSLTPIFEGHISTSSKIVTDKWRGYQPLKIDYNI